MDRTDQICTRASIPAAQRRLTRNGLERGTAVRDLGVDVSSQAFAARLGAFLKDVRQRRRLRLRHIADRSMGVATLRAIERGAHPLNPMLVAEVAARYGADLDELVPARTGVVLLATGTIAAGDLDEHFEPGDVDSIIEAYLRLVRRLRGADPAAMIALRRDDLIDIADQLGRPRPEIVDRVAVKLGASGAERLAMVDLYLAGANVIGMTH